MIKLYMYAVTLDATDGSIQGMLVAGVLPTPLEHEQATSLACQQIRESYPFADWIVTSFELSDITDDALGWVRTAYRTADEATLQERNEELGVSNQRMEANITARALEELNVKISALSCEQNMLRIRVDGFDARRAAEELAEEIEERNRNAPMLEALEHDQWALLNEQVHKLINRVDGHDKSLEAMEVSADVVDEALDAIRERMDALQTQLKGQRLLYNALAKSLTELDTRLIDVEDGLGKDPHSNNPFLTGYQGQHREGKSLLKNPPNVGSTVTKANRR